MLGSQRSRLGKREIVELVRRIARRHGECEVRVAPAFADEATRTRLRASFARGDLATWRYDATRADRAADPRTILHDAKSVICVAFAYATPGPRRAPLSGAVSNYAWSEDYHRRLQCALNEIAATIDALAGAPVTCVACDTKPLAERAFAARAGLGWIGRHTNLIAPRLGPFVFLGEIVTSLSIEPDGPLRKNCGGCTRCVEACPTNALRGDYTIDATRCISDLTQRTGSVPRHLRSFMGEWVWGCDICQRVCPPARRAGDRGSASDAPVTPDNASPDLLELLRMTASTFRKRFQPTAMGWRGGAVLRRNAAIALGNALDRAAVPSLVEALYDDPHPMVRGHAAWALGRIGSPRAQRALSDRLASESDATARDEILAALSKRPNSQCWQ